jgi:hypothetical protein
MTVQITENTLLRLLPGPETCWSDFMAYPVGDLRCSSYVMTYGSQPAHNASPGIYVLERPDPAGHFRLTHYPGGFGSREGANGRGTDLRLAALNLHQWSIRLRKPGPSVARVSRLGFTWSQVEEHESILPKPGRRVGIQRRVHRLYGYAA